MTDDVNVPRKLRAVGIAGSLRAGSYNQLLLDNVIRLCPDDLVIDPFTRMAEIPLFNEDHARQGEPPAVAELREAVRAADAIVIATPEYNYGVPGVLKNALDWISMPPGNSGLEGKAVALVGASPSILGTARAQSQLRQSFVFTQSHVVNHPEVFVTRAHTRFEDGNLIDPGATKLIGQLLANTVRLVRTLRSTSDHTTAPGATL
ncbi:chromate reductase [Rhodococcus sp. OK611]|uniref:NADPH-dependent FMN reductase n=1 Tax=unclassified Rhodococcus (in: high G+C Gram-positive bacteria) TaxID=192944 RepID=UPI000BDAC127|nr:MULTISPECIES: NADPH-dependent FMN reductase [unclassified Rhodococcus (in: high G+C Gram-positive bacteria)]PTR44990.1 chromate reductase [Rhodococcus sp. OK611]SNX89325.1 chromate reductase [Rhodococcus sp. OK270]